MNERAIELLTKAKTARLMLINGEITYHQARLIVDEYIDYYNEQSVIVAKKYNQSPRLINASSFLR